MTAPTTLSDLTAPESAFLAAMQRVGFGSFQYVEVRHGEIVLDPWPATLRDIKFAAMASPGQPANSEQELRPQVAEFFGQVRGIAAGEIRELQVRHGIPFSMRLELSAAQLAGGCRRA